MRERWEGAEPAPETVNAGKDRWLCAQSGERNVMFKSGGVSTAVPAGGP